MVTKSMKYNASWDANSCELKSWQCLQCLPVNIRINAANARCFTKSASYILFINCRHHHIAPDTFSFPLAPLNGISIRYGTLHVHFVYIIWSSACSKTSSSYRATKCFHFQFPVSSGLLKAMRYLLTSFSSPSRHSYTFFYLSFNNVFQNAVPTKYIY